MNTLLLFTSLVLGSYQVGDFHYYDDVLESRGLNMTGKLYVDMSSSEERKKFLKSIEKADGLERFKEIDIDRLNGLLLFFKTKENAFAALNQCSKNNYPVYPVFLYEGIEVSAINEIILKVQPNVSEADLLERLRDETKADYLIIGRRNPDVYIVKVMNLKYPSNILVLANLIAKDSFWIKSAMVYWSPLDGFIKASLSVETEANTNLGELRKLKLVIDVLDPTIVVRKDLLPQLGQTLVPFPNTGDLWFDVLPQEITETQDGRKRIITVVQSFRQLQYGNFVFQPVVVSYELNKNLRTVQSNVCEFGVRSVIEGTNIEDIQPRNFDVSLTVTKPLTMPWLPESDDIFMNSLQYPVILFLGGLSALFLSLAYLDLARRWSASKPDTRNKIWTELIDCANFSAHDWKKAYLLVSSKLNLVLTTFFGVSLYTIDPNQCNENFKTLVTELNKIYKEEDAPNFPALVTSLTTFCFDRKYD